ncbi:MAG: HIT family protein [Candidatus Staskawiczbacteria bacterium]|nr:HIT family protein [Candidatus Staskawiczbacteria bacterium]
MENCIFCKITSGQIDSTKVFEDEDVIAFLDVNPKALGHCLIIPKKHFENIFDIDQEILKKVMVATKNISINIKKSPDITGVNLISNNGQGAGQEVFHFHLHIIPSY